MITITHPEKLLFPADGITKADLADYYARVAPAMLPHIRGRPITMERYPRGIEAQAFWQKDVSKGFPAWLQRVEVVSGDALIPGALADAMKLYEEGIELSQRCRSELERAEQRITELRARTEGGMAEEEIDF